MPESSNNWLREIVSGLNTRNSGEAYNDAVAQVEPLNAYITPTPERALAMADRSPANGIALTALRREIAAGAITYPHVKVALDRVEEADDPVDDLGERADGGVLIRRIGIFRRKIELAWLAPAADLDRVVPIVLREVEMRRHEDRSHRRVSFGRERGFREHCGVSD